MAEFLDTLMSGVAYSLFGFLVGWVVGHEAQVIEEIREAVMDEHEDHTKKETKKRWTLPNKWNQPKFLGTVVVLLSLFTVMQTAYFTYQQRTVTECLADFNSDVSEVQNTRARWADEDRGALIDFFKTQSEDSQPTPEKTEEAFQTLIETYDLNTVRRAATPLPVLKACE